MTDANEVGGRISRLRRMSGRALGPNSRCAARTARRSMGWGVVQGMAALAAMTRSVEAVIGDATNVAFRLAGLAGRDGRRR